MGNQALRGNLTAALILYQSASGGFEMASSFTRQFIQPAITLTMMPGLGKVWSITPPFHLVFSAKIFLLWEIINRNCSRILFL